LSAGGAEVSVQLDLSRQLILGEVLARWARKTPNREAVVFRDKRYTYSQFNERVNRLANSLIGLGIEKGDKIAVLFMNCLEIVECYFALAKIGGVVVTNNFRLTGRELTYHIDQSDSKALIFGEMFQEVVDSIRPQLPKVELYICVSERDVEGTIDYEKLVQEGSPEEPLVPVEDDDPAFIMYTAGTTGRPKGAVLTHKNQLMMAVNMSIELLVQSEKQLLVFPIFHQAATGIVIVCVFLGRTMVILDIPTPENIMAAIQEEQIQHVALVPALWNWIVNHPNFNDYDLSSLEEGATGAAPMPLELKRKIVELFPNMRLSEAFGMTETSATGATAKHEDMLAKQGTVGRPRINVEARVVDDDDNDVPVGEVGEIVYRGPTVMKEYYNNPEATAEAFRGGWFHSGDLVRQDEDGYLYVVDRKKDMIISGGENIYPAEIEEVLYTHPKVLEATVIGVPDPDWGESIKAVVVPKQGETLTEEEVIDHCKKNIASYKKPKSVDFVDALPRNPQGKVLKFELREKYKK
jgi:acyl-CoA synthetase (AMP-forming)/AMP-acid ligase II